MSPSLPTDYDTLAIVIPCFNAGGRVRGVVESALTISSRVIVVDDGSTDGSMQSLSGLPMKIITLTRNRGKGHALLAGTQVALQKYDAPAVCFVDADGQHDPGDLPQMWDALVAANAEMAIGARSFSEGHVPWRSRFGNQLTTGIMRLVLRHNMPDTQCGFRILRRAFCEDVLRAVRGGRYETEMEIVIKAIRERRRMVSVPIAARYEPGNVSSHFRRISDSLLIYSRFLAAVLAPGSIRKNGGQS